MFSARQGKNESIDSWGNKIDELQTDLREAARRVCRPEEILGAIGLINHLGKAVSSKACRTCVFKLLFEAGGSRSSCPRLLICRWKKNAQFFQRRRGHPQQLMAPLRCNRCYRPGHVASKCSELSKVSPSSVKSVLSCFNCGREGHIARNCRKPARKVGTVRILKMSLGVPVETLALRMVSVETPLSLVEPRVRAGSDRETTEGSCRATRQPPDV